MRRILIIVLFLLIGRNVKSQTFVHDVIGRYLCERKLLDVNNNPVIPNCICYFELWPNTMFSNCVEYQDSCFGGGLWEHIYMEVEVLSDSTFQGFDPWTQPELATGKLYANDSIYYRIFYPSPPTYNRWKEFRGFKLYSFVGIEELNKPENELMISPQPASDVMHIQSTQVLFTQKEPPKLYDMSGKEIKLPVQFINANTYKVDVRGLSPGVFILAIKTEKGVLKKKFIVQH